MDLSKFKKGKATYGSNAVRLPVLDDGAPPSEFVIFKPGVNESDYGPLTFDDLAAVLVLKSHQEKGNPLYFDLNHGMFRQNPTAEDGKSYGEFDIEVRDGALMAVNCMWTEEGARLISKREYNLFSPAFRYFDDEDGVRRPYELVNVALVNLAGLDNIRPLAAGADLSEGDLMDPKEMQEKLEKALAAIAAKDSEIAQLRAKDATRGLLILAAPLGLAGDASIEDVSGAVRGLITLRADVRKIVGVEKDGDILGVLQAFKGSHERVALLSAEVETAKQADRDDKFAALLGKGVADGKVPPGLKPYWEGQCKEGGKVTERGLSMLTSYIETAPVLAAGPGEVAVPGRGSGQPPSVVATGLALQMGVGLDDYQLFKTDRAAWAEKVLKDRQSKQPNAQR